MSRRCTRTLAATLALALAACTQVRNPATGELQYTSLTPQQEKALGRAGAPQGAGAVRRAISRPRCRGLCRAGRQPGQKRVRAEGPAVHLHPARQRRGQRLRPARRLCLRDPRPAGADQQRGRARRRARARGRPRDRAHTAQRYDRRSRADRRDRGAAGGCGAGRPPGGSEGAQMGGQRPARWARRGRGLRAGLLARAGVRGRPAGRPLSRGRRLRSRRHGDLPGDAAGRRRLRAEPGRAGRRRGRFPRRRVPQPPAHAQRVERAVAAASAAVPAARETDRPDLLAAVEARSRRGSGAGRLSGPLPAPGPAHRLRGAAWLQAAELAGRGGGLVGQGAAMVFDMAPKDVAGDLRGYLQKAG